MDFETTYLSDEELNELINEIEKNDLVMAPPEIKEKVLKKATDNKKEFVMYCFRVLTSVAAAIAILLIIPGTMANGNGETQIPSREEVLQTQKYLSKKEALEEEGFVEKVLKNLAILEKNRVSAILMNENGGK